MNTNFLSSILPSLIYFIEKEPIIFALILVVILLIINSYLTSRRIKLLTKGGDGKTLEGTIIALGERTKALESYAKRNQEAVVDINRRLVRAVQSVSVERFDPFENAGQQSFSTSLLNERGEGVVMSGIHSRDGVRVYAKQISNFKSERELSKEESVSIEKAKEKLNGK